MRPLCEQLFAVLFCRHEFEQILDLAVEDGADSRKHVCIKTSYLVFAVVVYLCALHFGFVGQFILAYACFFDKLVELDFYLSVFVTHRFNSRSLDPEYIL